MGELSAEAVTKLLCTLPGIEQGLLAVMQTLAKFATESADREARMKRKIGELAAEVKDLKEELVVSKNSAIAWMQSKTTRNSSPVQADVHRTQSSTGGTRASKRSTKRLSKLQLTWNPAAPYHVLASQARIESPTAPRPREAVAWQRQSVLSHSPRQM